MSSRRALPDKKTHRLIVGELQPGLILHGALAQVNSCGRGEGGTQKGQRMSHRWSGSADIKINH